MDASDRINRTGTGFNKTLFNKDYTRIISDDTQPAMLIDMMESGPGQSFLDIGTGNGYVTYEFAKRCSSAHVVGIDRAEKAVKNNYRIVKENGNLSFDLYDGIRNIFEKSSLQFKLVKFFANYNHGINMRIRSKLFLFVIIAFITCSYNVDAQENTGSSLPQKGITNEVLWNKIVDIVVNKLGVDRTRVTSETSFKNDLSADALDMVEMVLKFEETFNIQIPDRDVEKITTVGEAYSYIEGRTK
jgi:acyl carrier protein